MQHSTENTRIVHTSTYIVIYCCRLISFGAECGEIIRALSENQTKNWDSSECIVTIQRTWRPRKFSIRTMGQRLLSSPVSISALGSIQPPVQWVPSDISPGTVRWGNDANPSPSLRMKGIIPPLLHMLSGLHKDSFKFLKKINFSCHTVEVFAAL